MAISKKLENFLELNNVRFEVIPHPKNYTALGTARVEHLPAQEVAKVVMVDLGEKPIMLVVPADRKVNFVKLSSLLNAPILNIEDEEEFMYLFPDCELGAMPPFGALYELPCYVDSTILEGEEICFNGGSHEEGVKISKHDFQKLGGFEVADFTMGVNSGV